MTSAARCAVTGFANVVSTPLLVAFDLRFASSIETVCSKRVIFNSERQPLRMGTCRAAVLNNCRDDHPGKLSTLAEGSFTRSSVLCQANDRPNARSAAKRCQKTQARSSRKLELGTPLTCMLDPARFVPQASYRRFIMLSYLVRCYVN